MSDLFSDVTEKPVWSEQLGPGSFLLHGFVLRSAELIYADLQKIATQASFRQMLTPGGLKMSVAITNCGAMGWISDRQGYRYAACDPLTDSPWPSLPPSFLLLAQSAAQQAGYLDFVPDACLINRYGVGTKMSLHQDRNERDFTAPIVSVSLGLPAVFMFGGAVRNDKYANVLLEHGDVMVWGGPDRLRFHGIKQLKSGDHPLCGNTRFNLTFRKAG
jgi:alkylated DNA repair protein (DNA oxidative demethylase)